jgi:hypothetical protein
MLKKLAQMGVDKSRIKLVGPGGGEGKIETTTKTKSGSSSTVNSKQGLMTMASSEVRGPTGMSPKAAA